MASYPNSVKSFTTHTDNSGEYIMAAHINDIQNEVTAIETQLGVNAGTWINWTPTVTYSGGTTDPTTTTVTAARYCKINKIVNYAVRIDFVRGSGDRNTIDVSVPINFGSINGLGYARQTVLSGSTNILFMVAYSSGNVFRLSLGAAMNLDGYIVLAGFYEIA